MSRISSLCPPTSSLEPWQLLLILRPSSQDAMTNNPPSPDHSHHHHLHCCGCHHQNLLYIITDQKFLLMNYSSAFLKSFESDNSPFLVQNKNYRCYGVYPYHSVIGKSFRISLREPSQCLHSILYFPPSHQHVTKFFLPYQSGYILGPHPCDTLVSIELHISLDHPPHSFPDKTIHEPVKSAKLAFPREHHRHQVYLNDHCKNPRKNPPKNSREQKGLNLKLTPLYIT